MALALDRVRDPQGGADPGMRPAVSALRRLTLHDFRSYSRLRLEADPRPVVLTGPNGAGKTNLLEAISFLSPGRGLRRARLAEVDRIGGGPWTVSARIEGARGALDLATARVQDGERERRLVRIDGATASQPGDARREPERGLAHACDGPAVQRGRRRQTAFPRSAGAGRRSGPCRPVFELQPWPARARPAAPRRPPRAGLAGRPRGPDRGRGRRDRGGAARSGPRPRRRARRRAGLVAAA